MIAKKIHFCWFGYTKKSKNILNCIASWKKYCPDFEIIEWNESNFNVNECHFSKTAYEQKKWAYVADYARFKILYAHGGIYLDTDMLLKKDLTALLNNNFFLGFQDFYGVNDSIRIAAGIVWMNSSNKIGNYFLKYYLNIQEKNLIIDRKFVIPEVIKQVLERHKYNYKQHNILQVLKEDITLYPIIYFYWNTLQSSIFAIHLWEWSWLTPIEKIQKKCMSYSIKILQFLGIKNSIRQVYRYIKCTLWL